MLGVKLWPPSRAALHLTPFAMHEEEAGVTVLRCALFCGIPKPSSLPDAQLQGYSCTFNALPLKEIMSASITQTSFLRRK